MYMKLNVPRLTSRRSPTFILFLFVFITAASFAIGRFHLSLLLVPTLPTEDTALILAWLVSMGVSKLGWATVRRRVAWFPFLFPFYWFCHNFCGI